jgi:tRNA A37 threonylcarbamoyltransferase TsaD
MEVKFKRGDVVVQNDINVPMVKMTIETFIPPFAYCTDNAAMIGITGWFTYNQGIRSEITESSQARLPF